MKLKELKAKVYQATDKSTKQLKQVHSHLDLRRKASWEYLVNYYSKPVNNIFRTNGSLRKAMLPSDEQMLSAISGKSQFCDLPLEEFEAMRKVKI